MLFKISLVTLFSAVKRWCGRDHSSDCALVAAAVLEPFLRSQRCRLLLRRMIENRRPILVLRTRSLWMRHRWIVHFPEQVQERLVGHLVRIVFKPHRFSVSRCAGANVTVCRMVGRSSGIDWADVTLGILRQAASTPQKQPAANVAFPTNSPPFYCFDVD